MSKAKYSLGPTVVSHSSYDMRMKTSYKLYELAYHIAFLVSHHFIAEILMTKMNFRGKNETTQCN